MPLTEPTSRTPNVAPVIPPGHDVCVSGFYGREVQELELESLPSAPYAEVYFRTASGNQYAVLPAGKYGSDPAHGAYLLLDRNTALQDREDGNPLRARSLPENVVDTGAISVGEPFDYQVGGTTNVQSITVVDRNQKHPSDSSVGRLPQSDALTEFWEGLAGSSKQRQETVKEHDSPPSRAEKIVKILLYPEEANFDLYSDLVGSTPTAERKHWDPERQKLAEAGMLKLFQTAIEPVRFAENGLQGARRALQRLQTLSEHQKLRNDLIKRGRDLHYQNMTKFDYVKGTEFSGDFLQFGVEKHYSDAPDKLPLQAHIYVVPKSEAIGIVAATFIRKVRERDCEPLGKVWDESSCVKPLEDRKDRISIYARTESELRIVMETLAEMQAASPELFEEDLPLLAESTDIPGVGISEQPARGALGKESSTSVKAELLQEAWKDTLTQLIGPQDFSDFYNIPTGSADGRNRRLQLALANGKISMDGLVQAYRDNAVRLAPIRDLSADQISRIL